MNKFLLLFGLFLALTLNVQSQISFDHDTNEAGGFTNEFDVAIHNKFTNNSDFDTFRWVRKNNVLSPSWESAVCDNIQCHDVIVDSAKFVLKKGAFFDFIIHFYPYNKTGSGSMEVSVYAIDDPSIFATATYTATIWGLGINKMNSQLKLFPNPANQTVTISGNQLIEQVNLFNMSGQLVNTFEAHSNTLNINVNALHNGIYLAEIKTAEGTIREKFSVSK